MTPLTRSDASLTGVHPAASSLVRTEPAKAIFREDHERWLDRRRDFFFKGPDKTAGPPLMVLISREGRVAFAWPATEAFFEEDERIMGRAADSYHRIDVRQSSRNLVVRYGERIYRRYEETAGAL